MGEAFGKPTISSIATIIRGGAELACITADIQANPARWQEDREFVGDEGADSKGEESDGKSRS